MTQAARLPQGVLVVDDHQLVAQSLTIALNSRGMSAVRCTDVRAEAVLDLAASMRPGLVLLDLDLGEDNDGVDLVADLRRLGSDVLVFTGSSNRFRICAAVAAGALGWVSKSVSFDTLLSQVLDAAGGQPVHTPTERQELLRDYERGRAERRELRASVGQLTPREGTVLRRLADGLHADAVAAELNVSVHTVRAQIRAIHTKLDVDSQLAAIAIVRHADELGLRTPLREH